MAGAVTRIGRKRAKTWSSFGDLGRKPSEYEVVTHNMNHTFRADDGQPLEMGPDVQGNVWLREHRDQHIFGVEAWNDFRDPDKLTYRKYCQVQDESETYIDELLKNFTVSKKADASLDAHALQFLSESMTPQRYLGHGQQMLSCYIQQMAPSTYVSNCATFQAADTLRRVQRVAYRTKQLDNENPSFGFGHGERAMWEKDSSWQPVREAIEKLMVEYDFDRAVSGFQLCVKPMLDNLFLNQFAIVARSLGAEVDALIAENLYADSLRHQRWTVDFVKFVIEKNSTGKNELRTLLSEFRSLATVAVEAGSELLSRHANTATAEAYSVKSGGGMFGGKGKPAQAVASAIQSRVFADYTAFIGDAGLSNDA